MPGSLSSFWVIRCTLQHFRILRFQNATPTVSIQFQLDFMESIVVGPGGYTPAHNYFFWQSAKLKKNCSLKCFLTPDDMGWKFLNATPPTFSIQSQQNIMRTLLTVEKYRLLIFFGSPPSSTKFYSTEALTWKNPKMCNIRKTADHRAKQKKN